MKDFRKHLRKYYDWFAIIEWLFWMFLSTGVAFLLKLHYMLVYLCLVAGFIFAFYRMSWWLDRWEK
ncbi:MAG: hypothetical protein ACTSRS_21710 [Candidatus Helarchaeota archaeon]